MQAILRDAYGGTDVEFQAQVSESVLARIAFTVRLPEGADIEPDPAEVEARLIEAARAWTDDLQDALDEAEGEEEGNRLYRTFGVAMPRGYQDRVPPRAAVADILRLDQVAAMPDGLTMSLYRPLEHDRAGLRFKLYHADTPVTLSDALPMLENMGLRVIEEINDPVVATNGRRFHMHDFGTVPQLQLAAEVDELRDPFHEAFARLWRGEAENDGFNRLILGGALTSRDVEIIRAYCKYALQVGSPFSQAYIEATLVAHPQVATDLARLFEARFDPAGTDERAERVESLTASILRGIEQVASLDEDRILRRYLRMIEATLRTNAFQTTPEGAAKPYLSIKLDPAKVPGMPLPRPAYEIFVYSPRVEGVHLRGGKVARGGIRWSDRREDFRTEILGLMKAQMVKNAVIVPVGAKGGFYVKRPPAERDAVRAEAQACYQLFIRGLLDLTDNRVGDIIEPPADTVRYDEDDPYLVVAADKGTATYSDVANAISGDYGFWLGDAFASGGSAGYDHKVMGITARGAWESVKRHFYEMGRDCQTEPFTCVGVGDMSGDVFGNGMLLSRATRLLAAFDHRHIFIDPDPDPEVSWAERKRMFELPRSSWADYDLAKISAGGGVWPRTAKTVPLSPAARAALGIEAASLSPVDLFWNGGIGTFVKARAERHGDAQDRTNDSIRVDAEDLRCKMIGEGGNLGVTQLGRIVFAREGGRINTDAIDNSAGVDCSDHEVNIKILLDRVVADGDMTLKQRNELLAAMTDEVGQLVLRDNIEQVRALSVRRAEGAAVLDAQAAFMRRLEAEGRLSREVEFLPNDEELAELRQAGQGLTRPELAVLMAYAKTTLYDELLASDLPDDGYFGDDLVAYFPQPLRERFRAGIDVHRLRREIVATEIANGLANQGQDLFASERRQETGQPGPEIARAYVVARDALGVVDLWEAAEGLETVLPAERQLGLLQDMVRVLGFGTRWCLRNLPKSYDIGQMVARYRTGVAVLIERPRDVLPDEMWQPLGAVTAELEAAGVEPALALRFATLPLQVPSFDVAEIASGCDVPVGCATEIYFATAAGLDLARLRRQFERAEPKDRWTRLALEGLVDDLLAAQRRLTANALNDGLRDGAAVPDWLVREERAIARIGQLVEELENEPTPSLALFGVVVRSLAALSRPATSVAA
jgi:glutamate dehydrogenase